MTVIKIIIAVYVLLVFLATFALEKDKKKRLSFFIYCLIFTPITGMFKKLILIKKTNGIHTVVHYRCERCGFEFTQPQEYCSLCAKEGVRVKLKRHGMKIH